MSQLNRKTIFNDLIKKISSCSEIQNLDLNEDTFSLAFTIINKEITICIKLNKMLHYNYIIPEITILGKMNKLQQGDNDKEESEFSAFISNTKSDFYDEDEVKAVLDSLLKEDNFPFSEYIIVKPIFIDGLKCSPYDFYMELNHHELRCPALKYKYDEAVEKIHSLIKSIIEGFKKHSDKFADYDKLREHEIEWVYINLYSHFKDDRRIDFGYYLTMRKENGIINQLLIGAGNRFDIFFTIVPQDNSCCQLQLKAIASIKEEIRDEVNHLIVKMNKNNSIIVSSDKVELYNGLNKTEADVSVYEQIFDGVSANNLFNKSLSVISDFIELFSNFIAFTNKGGIPKLPPSTNGLNNTEYLKIFEPIQNDYYETVLKGSKGNSKQQDEPPILDGILQHQYSFKSIAEIKQFMNNNGWTLLDFPTRYSSNNYFSNNQLKQFYVYKSENENNDKSKSNLAILQSCEDYHLNGDDYNIRLSFFDNISAIKYYKNSGDLLMFDTLHQASYKLHFGLDRQSFIYTYSFDETDYDCESRYI